MRFLYNFPDEGSAETGGGTETTDATATATAAATAVKPTENKPDDGGNRRAVDWEQADKQARFWAKATPEERARYMELIEKQGTPQESPELKELREEVKASRLESARDKALLKFDLDEDDLDLLTADTPEGIMLQAQRLKERYDKRSEAAANSGSDAGKEAGTSRKPREYKPADTPANDSKTIAAKLAKDPWMG